MFAFDLTLGTVSQMLQMSLVPPSLYFDCVKFLVVVGTDVSRVPSHFCACAVQSTSQQPPYAKELF